MGFFERLMGLENPIEDLDIASDMLIDSKFTLMSLGKAISEVTNPQLRELILNHLLTAVKQHHRLADMASAKEWYKTTLPPQQQVQEDLHLAENLT